MVFVNTDMFILTVCVLLLHAFIWRDHVVCRLFLFFNHEQLDPCDLYLITVKSRVYQTCFEC
jgi:hypothetical protein